MKNCIRLTAALACLAMGAPASAAGINKVKLFTVSNATLGGYVVTPPTGWIVGFNFVPGSLATSATQEFVAYNYATQNGSPTTLPPSIVFNRLNSAGVRLSSDAAPAAVQVTQADCTLPNNTVNPVVYNACPSVGAYGLYPAAQNPGRLIIPFIKQTYTSTTRMYGNKYFYYVFDPSTSVAGDRWTLVATSSLLNYASNGSYPSISGGTTNSYVFDLSVAGSSTVYQLLNK